jgi:hypothetical protein
VANVIAQSRIAQTRCRLRLAGQNKSNPANASPSAPSPGLSRLVVVVAAVFTESRVDTTVVPDTVMLAGLKLQLEFVGRPEHPNVTAPENPAAPVTLMGAHHLSSLDG